MYICIAEPCIILCSSSSERALAAPSPQRRACDGPSPVRNALGGGPAQGFSLDAESCMAFPCTHSSSCALARRSASLAASPGRLVFLALRPLLHLHLVPVRFVSPNDRARAARPLCVERACEQLTSSSCSLCAGGKEGCGPSRLQDAQDRKGGLSKRTSAERNDQEDKDAGVRASTEEGEADGEARRGRMVEPAGGPCERGQLRVRPLHEPSEERGRLDALGASLRARRREAVCEGGRAS